MAKGGGGMMEIILVIALIGGFALLWPNISARLSWPNGAGAGAVQTDTSGGGKADADDGGGGGASDDEDDCTNVRNPRAMAECIRDKTRRMIGRTRRKAGRGGGIRQINRGGSGTNVHVSGKGGRAVACVNGRCTSAYGEMSMDFSNVV